MKKELETSSSIIKTARIAGLLYFLQIPLGVFGLLFIPKTLVVINDTANTIKNILEHEFLFRLSIISSIITALLTVMTAMYIYKVLKSVNKAQASLIVLAALVVAPISLVNELNHVAILLLLKSPDGLGMFTANQQHVLISTLLELHSYGLKICGIFFGLWLLPMGLLVYRSKFIPKIIGILLVITCLGYLIDFVTYFCFPGFGLVVSDFAWPGEVLMVLWLLIKGVRIEDWEKRRENRTSISGSLVDLKK